MLRRTNIWGTQIDYQEQKAATEMDQLYTTHNSQVSNITRKTKFSHII